jgi:hypothetical protein
MPLDHKSGLRKILSLKIWPVLVSIVLNFYWTPILSASDNRDLAIAIGAQFYARNMRTKCWILTAPDTSGTEKFCLRLSSVTDIETHGGTLKFIVFDGRNLTNQAHVSNGLIGLFVEQTINGTSVITAIDKAYPSGSWGDPNTDVGIAKIGPDLWAFVVKQGYSSGGATEGSQSIIPVDIRNIAQTNALPRIDMPEALYFCPLGVVDEQKCTDLTFSIRFDERDVHGGRYTLIMTAMGRIARKKISETYRFKWDDLVQLYGPIHYPLPDDFDHSRFMAEAKRLQSTPANKPK